MTAYYNENNPHAAAWLQNLMDAGAIAPGVVDDRSISDVRPSDLIGFTQCHFFAGIGGWSAALRLAGWSDSRPVWTGSCPCQPFSTGGKGATFDDERHLWPDWFWLIDQCRPNTIFGEQVASPNGFKWFDLVSSDLEAKNYAIGAADLCAASVGAPHIRQRLYWVADAGIQRQQRQYALLQSGRLEAANTEVTGRSEGASVWSTGERSTGADGKTRVIEPGITPVVDGVLADLDGLHGFGNAIVPQVAAAFIGATMEAQTV